MKKIFRGQFLAAIIVYLLFAGLATIPLYSYFQKIKVANEKYREKQAAYLNWQFKKEAVEIGSKGNCEGDLFFRAQTPIAAIHVHQDQLYLSGADGKLTVIDLKNPKLFSSFETSLLTDFYSNPSELIATEILNDRVVKILFPGSKIKTEEVYDKIGRASALTRDSKGNLYVSGYASGNITKIIGRDGFLFASDLDKVADLEIKDQAIYVALYNSSPSLLKLDLGEGKKTIIEENKSFSSLVFDGDNFWTAYNSHGQTQIGKIIDDKLVDSRPLNCQFPVKITFWKDKLFYTSLADSEGKVYSLNKNLQSKGR